MYLVSCDEKGDVSEDNVVMHWTGLTRLSLVVFILSAREAPVVRPGRWRTLPGMRWLCYPSARMVIEGHWKSTYVASQPPVGGEGVL